MNFFKRNCFASCREKVFIFFVFFIFIFHCNLGAAKGSEKIGVLYSYQNVESYRNSAIVGFYQVWKSFVETFSATYLDHKFICNISAETKAEDLGVSTIFFPLAIDISQDEQNFLASFIGGGGKLVVSSGIGPISDNLRTFLSKHGIKVTDNLIAQSTLNLKHKNSNITFELPSGNFYSVFELTGNIKKIAARWKENNKDAIGGTTNLLYIGYSWGQDIDKNNDIKIFLKTLDYYWVDLSSRLTKEITKDEYIDIVKETYAIKEQANSVIKTVKQLDLSVPRYQLDKHFEDGVAFLNNFNSNYLLGNFLLARENATSAKNEFAIVYSLGIPSRKIEIRAVWLDRGTIVGCRNASELRDVIRKLVRTGFNTIFFETINAGYPIYPSKLLPQNPQVKGWDPLQVAIEAAHNLGAELHSWVWTFACGNTKHNLLISQEVQYPGPIIAQKGRSWALAGADGKLRVEMQGETWLSPANKKACLFLQELFSEIITNYNVDGLQLDYIRFPFQKKHSQVGFDFITKNAYKAYSGKSPEIEGIENINWREWKAKLISDFVRDTSQKLKQIKPNLKISAAVFALGHASRMLLIQQDWESWAINKWVDAIYPFYYSFTKEEIATKLSYAKQSIKDQAIIIPAFNLRVLSVGEVAERISLAKNSGVLGVALFAAEHLNDTKEELLKKGPFREQTTLLPYNNPHVACKQLLDEFTSIIEKYTLAKKRTILSDSKTEKEVYLLTHELRNDFRNFSQDKAGDIREKLNNLQLKVKEWLSLEKYLNRDQRAMYISTYLEQMKALLNYMKADSTNTFLNQPSPSNQT